MSEGAADVSCNEAREDLSALIDAALPRERQATLEEHLASCGACREEHAALLAVAKQVRSLPPVSAPPDFVATLFARLDGGDASVAEAPAAAEPRNRATPARPAGEPGAKPCEALAEDLSALLDRHLEGEAAALARRHLAECAACRERQAAWQRVRDRVGALPPLRAPADFLERVWAQIESLEEERRLAQRRRLEARSAFWSGAVRLGRAAAVLLAIGGGFWLAAPGDGARLSLVSSFGPAAQRLAPNSERPRAQRTRRGAPPPAPAEQALPPAQFGVQVSVPDAERALQVLGRYAREQRVRTRDDGADAFAVVPARQLDDLARGLEHEARARGEALGELVRSELHVEQDRVVLENGFVLVGELLPSPRPGVLRLRTGNAVRELPRREVQAIERADSPRRLLLRFRRDEG